MCACEKSQSVWLSKNSQNEKPYCVTGTNKLTGSEQRPKGVCTDRNIGTRKGIEYPHAGIGGRNI